MLEFSKNYSFITYNRTFFCKRMPYPSRRPEHFHIEVLNDVTLTVKYPIDIKVALQPKGIVELPLGSNSYSFQNQSAIDSFCNFCDQSKQVLILNKDSITSLLLPIGTKVSLTQENISYHFENATEKQLSITDLNLFINTYEYLTGELSTTLSLIASNDLILLEIEDTDKTYLRYYKKDKDLIDLFDKQNKKIINHEEIDLFIKYYYLQLWHSDVNHNEYIDDHTSTSLLGTLE
ncbi:MAG: hypothetical protein LN568_03680 [Rickettsia endosymbiont of Pseudomimeciton antennatum]|nr:hypothetical protein [Rickettsia endosymbiont of Pseudomimeciton antennatum]